MSFKLDNDSMDAAKLAHSALACVATAYCMSPAALHAAAAFIREAAACEEHHEARALVALANFWEQSALFRTPSRATLLLPDADPQPFRYAHSAWPEAFPIHVEALIRATSRYNRKGNPARTEETVRSFIESYGEGDAYLLPNINGHHCLGYRYGSEGHQYLSFPAEQEDLDILHVRYSPSTPPTHTHKES